MAEIETAAASLDDETTAALTLFNEYVDADRERTRREKKIKQAERAKDEAAAAVRKAGESGSAEDKAAAEAAYREAQENFKKIRDGEDAEPAAAAPAEEASADATDEEASADATDEAPAEEASADAAAEEAPAEAAPEEAPADDTPTEAEAVVTDRTDDDAEDAAEADAPVAETNDEQE